MHSLTQSTRRSVILVHGRETSLVHDQESNNGSIWSGLWSKSNVRRENAVLRVFSFEYRDRIHTSYRAQAISTYAENLLQKLVAIRSEHPEDMRPLVFIGHSTGAVIIKQVGEPSSGLRIFFFSEGSRRQCIKALVYAQHDLRFRNIAYSTFLIASIPLVHLLATTVQSSHHFHRYFSGLLTEATAK